MRIAVVGAGMVGVATAFELATDGHAVEVFERRAAIAEEASFSHAGLLGPGVVAPWRMPIRMGWRLGWGERLWLMRHSRQAKPARVAARLDALHALAQFSQTRRQQLVHDLRLQPDHKTGLMLLFREDRDLQAARPQLQALRAAGSTVTELGPAQARELELALNADTAFAGAAYLPHDETGNCRQFALLLRNAAQDRGARFHLHATVAPPSRRTPLELRVNGRTDTFDAVVVCAGAAARDWLRPAGIRLKLASVQGHAINAQLREPLNAPQSAMLDVRHGIAISCVGRRVRVSGAHTMGFAAGTRNDAAIQQLYRVLHDWFPGAAQVNRDVQEWQATQAFMPDGLPVIGASAQPGIWLNLGFGGFGGALAHGAARALADAMAGRTPATDLTGFAPSRRT